jgi:hypothetical protein
MRNNETVTVRYVNSVDMVVERENGSLCLLLHDGRVLTQGGPMWEDLIEQVVEPKYRPFASAAEFDPYREKWLINKGSLRARVNWYSDTLMLLCRIHSWQEAFELYTFEDGTLFGIEIEVNP